MGLKTCCKLTFLLLLLLLVFFLPTSFLIDHRMSEEKKLLYMQQDLLFQAHDTEIQMLKTTDTVLIEDNYRLQRGKIKEVVDDRMKRVRTHCSENYGPNYRYNTLNIYNISELGFLWCPVFKAGSSTWRNFIINKVKPNAVTHELDELKGKRLSGRGYLFQRTKNGTSGKYQSYKMVPKFYNIPMFTVVRHPVDRLISFYKNKMVENDYNMMVKWGIETILEERRVNTWSGSAKERYTQELKEFYDQPDKDKRVINLSNPYLNPPHPLFNELVSYMIKRKRTNSHPAKQYDGHWSPSTVWCNVCRNRFEYIIKLENNPSELLYLLEELGLYGEREYFLFQKQNPSNSANVMTGRLKYLSTLTLSQAAWINNAYKLDFELFGYDKLDLNLWM